SAETRDRGGDRLAATGFVRKIREDRMDAVGGRERVEPRGVAVDRRDAVPSRDQRARDRRADAAGRAGDENNTRLRHYDLSTVMPAALMMGPQRSISDLRCAASAAGVEPTTCAPSLA